MTVRWRSTREPHPRAPLKMTAEVAGAIRLAARLVGAFSLVAFGVLAFSRGIPRSLENEAWEQDAQVALVVLLAAGYLLAWKWEGLGAAVLVTAGVALGVVASIEHPPLLALFTALAFVLPGFAFAVHWQWHAGPWRLLVPVVLVPLILLVGGLASTTVYDSYYGPTHPASATKLARTDLVRWAWSGGLTGDGFVVKARLVDHVPSGVALRVGVARQGGYVTFPGIPVAGWEGDIWEFRAVDLEPATAYWYAVEVDDRVDLGRRGEVMTLGDGPMNFTIAMGSCMRTGSDGTVFDLIRESRPLFFVVPGDFMYENLVTRDPAAFLDAYSRNLLSDAQEALYLSTPLVYAWDDHDFGGNNSDASSVSREAAREAYAALVPHYPLPAGDGGAIYQAFTVGRVRFIVTDPRSERLPNGGPDGYPTMLGAEQKSWFKAELLAAKDRYPLIVWVNGVPWIAEAQPGSDNWGGYAEEREEIANFVAEHGIHGLAMVSGDAHMVAIDDGSHSNYATNGGDASFPVLQAAALDRPGSVKGGPYSEGTFPGGGRFALMTVRDQGAAGIAVEWTGMTYEGEVLVRFGFTVGETPASASDAGR